MGILLVQGTCWEDGGCTCMARVLDNDGSRALQADVASISRSIFDLDGATPTVAVSGPTDIPVATGVYDTLQTDDRWSEDATGYNFANVVPASVFSSGGHRYRIEYKFTPVGGQVYWTVYEVLAESVYTS